MRRDACVLTMVGLAAAIGYAQQAPPPVVRATATGVVIDVTVLDNKGQPVLDLTPADFEVREEGKFQPVLSVTLVQRGLAKAAPADTALAVPHIDADAARIPAAPATAVEPDRKPTVTAIVFTD